MNEETRKAILKLSERASITAEDRRRFVKNHKDLTTFKIPVEELQEVVRYYEQVLAERDALLEMLGQMSDIRFESPVGARIERVDSRYCAETIGKQIYRDGQSFFDTPLAAHRALQEAK